VPNDRIVVLVIEDEVDLRESIAELLAGDGFGVVTANNGVEGILRLRSESPSIVLLDMMMPVLDGIGFLEQKRALEAELPPERHVPVLVVSAAPDPVALVPFDDVKGIVSKPFSFDTLRASLASALDATWPPSGIVRKEGGDQGPLLAAGNKRR
jgi:CheY-like chemotaxis protein